ERDDLDKLRQEFQRQVHLKEAEIAERRKHMEDEFQARWEAVQKEVQTLKRSTATGSAHDPAKHSAQKQDLEALAQKLKKKDEDLNAETQEIQRERDELERLRSKFEDERIKTQKEL